jgi:hypothetical protein
MINSIEIKNNRKLGGENRVVVIDESLFVRVVGWNNPKIHVKSMRGKHI